MTDVEKLIISELRDLKQEVGTVRLEVAALKVKSGVWGFIAGAIPAALALVWYWVKSKLTGG